MNSIEKLQRMAAEYSGPPAPDDGPLELMFRSAAMTIGPMLIDQLPDDPAVLDDGLVEMAGKLLDLRSDGAPAAMVERPQLPAGG